ncbi:c-type cytochrome [Emticicia sp. 21SJ11W-3]|uniref:c-type cytochrome n=1 Tax=Emticicia sp. 21SJ11W-3 TaxID=2916755 RepID=UPI0020A06917|nr:c-type cytochrome [Emticicia sp. 21SJ11W-3]UTA67594.1 c-type cytochrome [Emticicia sp. 21SJ11W-3]
MIRNFYKSLLALAVVVTISFSNAFAQDSTATAAAPAGGGDTALGEKLFKENCAQCHAPTSEQVVGPGLAGVETRRDFAWLKKWINNPMGVIASGDKYANELFVKFNKTPMTAFPSFTDEQVRAILDYVKVASAPAAPTADPGGGTTATATAGDTGSGKFVTVIMIALLVIMGLVLVALLGILQLLNKLTGTTEGTEGSAVSAGEKIQLSIKQIVSNKTVRSAIIWVFVLLATKATFDGLYGIGVHQGYAPKQPISFSHKLHAGEMKINCAYCHTGVYKGKQSGIPSANICMNCHNTIKRESPEIQKIYTAIETNKPIEWVRVHNLPDLAYFNHAQHTNVGGLDCNNCHGEIAKMEVVQQRATLTMGWCVDCHRKTEVNGKDNAYYDKLMEAHNAASNGTMKVSDIGGLECARCHY